MINVGVIGQSKLPSILHRIEIHAKTGLLTLKCKMQEAELYFQHGQVTSIGLKGRPSLGERLVQAGLLSQSNLREVLAALGNGRNRIGFLSGNGSDHFVHFSDLSIAQKLIEFNFLTLECLDTWMTQEAVTILQEILTWSGSEVCFSEEVQHSTDCFPLDKRVVALISSFANGNEVSFSSLIEKPSAPILPTTPFLFGKSRIKSEDGPTTPATPLPTFPPIAKPRMQKTSLPARPLFAKAKTTVETSPTLVMQGLKSDPHLEQFNTFSIAALKAITQPKGMNNLKIRITGTLFVVASLFYIPWVMQSLNTKLLWFSLPFLLATLYITLFLLITIYNNWNRSAPQLYKLPDGLEPVVAIFIPTYGEPVEMVQKTIESVLRQNWPKEAMVIIIGDDGHNEKMQLMVETMQADHLPTRIHYHLPPPKGSDERMGKAKDGNLNSMLKFLKERYPDILFVETRDADDVVGNQNFLRYAVGHLVSNPKAAYVQTIKEAVVSEGDPFGNLQPAFYRGLMLSKHATNSVFPCGSGLVWKKKDLDKIGGFPTWNLVEDLYSGYVALQHGLKGSYLPIVGAIGQTAPEDIPNVYKQLGTWALDTARLFIWKNPWRVKGLTFQQRMHFTEMGLFYFSSFIQIIFLVTPSICLFSGMYPLQVHASSLFIPFILAYTFVIDLFVMFLGHDVTFKDTWRTKQLFVGMIFVYMKACYLAIRYGPNKKPTYKVTRKVQMVGFYFKEVLFQILLFLFLLCSIIYDLAIHTSAIQQIDFGSIFWALLYMVILSSIISKSWFGMKLRK